MELIRKTKVTITKNGNRIQWAIFKCPFCLQEVERTLGAGLIAKSCGCARNELISKGDKGKKRTLESRKKQSESNKGRTSPNKGKETWNKGKKNIYTEKTLQKMRDSAKLRFLIPENNPMFGKKQTEETRQKISESNKGKSKNKGIKNPFYGKNHTEEIRNIISEKLKGEKNPSWVGGISFEIYPQEFNKELKQFILERDNYACQCPNCKHLSERLEVHHIDYDKKNNNPENLIILCGSCHGKTKAAKNRLFWINFYQNIIMEKYI